ncbi:MAG TPA: PAS domain S-box protein, partial [Ignavibacteria bacterium]
MHQIAGKRSKKILSSKQINSKEFGLENGNHKIIFDNLDTPVCLIKENNNKEFFYQEVNQAFSSLNNKNPCDYNGKPVKELLNKKEYDLFIKSLQKAKKKGLYVSEEKIEKGSRKKYLSNRIICKTHSGSISYYICTLTDITEHIELSEEFERQGSRSNKYLEIAGVMIIVLDEDGSVKVINKKGCEILGYEKKEILGKNWFKNFIPEQSSNNMMRSFA